MVLIKDRLWVGQMCRCVGVHIDKKEGVVLVKEKLWSWHRGGYYFGKGEGVVLAKERCGPGR